MKEEGRGTASLFLEFMFIYILSLFAGCFCDCWQEKMY